MIISLIFTTLIFFLILAMIMGAPAVFSKKPTVERMIDLLRLKPGKKVVDLGAGDGRIVIAAAKSGLQAVGIEINPYLALLGYFNIINSGVGHRAKIKLGSYWKIDLGEYDGVLVYGIPSMMRKLSAKLKAELKPGTPVVSNAFQIPELKLVKNEMVGSDRIYLYEI